MQRKKLFTEKFTEYKSTKKSAQEIKSVRQSMSTKDKILNWLNDVAAELVSDQHEYASVYAAAEKGCENGSPNISIAKYRLDNRQPIIALPPDLSVAQIAKEISENAIELPIKYEDSQFNGCRLRVCVSTRYDTIGSINDDNISGFIVFNLLAAPLTLASGPKIIGFDLEIDISPAPKSRCEIM